MYAVKQQREAVGEWMAQVTLEQIQAYLDNLSSKGCSQGTLQTYRRSLMHFSISCQRANGLAGKPFPSGRSICWRRGTCPAQ